MKNGYVGQERRKFMRFNHPANLKYKIISAPKSASREKAGRAKNISTSGILFKTDHQIALGETVWVQVDYRNLEICKEIENRALVQYGGLIGKVVRVEEALDGDYDIGLCFLINEDPV